VIRWVCETGGADVARRIGTGNQAQYQNRLQTPANRWHVVRRSYQKKSCKSALSHGFSRPTENRENRGVPGSIPGLAISKDACTWRGFGRLSEAVWGPLKGAFCAPRPFHVLFLEAG
jgi:hypothetical protein